MVGQTISHYRILEKLGEGGMGVVFKAEDLKLRRTVAIKFLPKHLSVHGEERDRFTLEAQAASALNHPNVATIYEIDEADGETFIVMEYVEGQTLREVNRTLSIKQVVDIGIQVAEGLAAAHDKGIVHRDVKAENVMLRRDGRVQVMDFGLAKLRGVSKLTKVGSTVGTMAYMSPEQVQGIETDHRTDIFSLGVLLYELLSRQLPFNGAHEAAVMYEIVNVHPQPVSSFRTDVEPELERIVMKCLEKDREERYHSVKDVAVDLKHFRRDSEGKRIERRTPVPAGTPVPAPAAAEPTPARGRRWLPVALGAGVLVVAGIGLWQFLKPPAEVAKNRVFKSLQVPFTTIWYPGLSADGNWVAFPATDANNVTELYYMHVSGGEPKQLTNDSVWKFTADISPDGSQIVYARGLSRNAMTFPLEVYDISTLGGASKKLADAGNGPRWSPDGTMIAYVGIPKTPGLRSALWVMNADGSNKQMILEDSLAQRVSLAWSPDGKALAWLRSFLGPAGIYQEIITVDVESKKERQITHEQKNIDELYWMPQGEILFSSNREGPSNLWAIPSDGGTLVQVTNGPGPDLGIKASKDGRRVLYMQQAAFGAVVLADADGRNGRQITPDDQQVSQPRFSPDGKQIAFLVNDPDPIKPFVYLYLINRDGSNRRQLTTAHQYVETFRWSPEGRKIAYSIHLRSEVDSTHLVEVIDVADPSQRVELGKGQVLQWMRDGASVNVRSGDMSWRVPVDGGKRELLAPDSSVVLVSPDGRNLCMIKRGGDSATISMKLPNKPPRVVLRAGGVWPRLFQWLPNSTAMVGADRRGIWTLSAETGKFQPYPWKTSEAVALDDLSAGGEQSLYVRGRMNAKLILIDNFH